MADAKASPERVAWVAFACGAGAYLALVAIFSLLGMKTMLIVNQVPLLGFAGMLEWLFLPGGTPAVVWFGVGSCFYGTIVSGIAWVIARNL